MIDVYESSVDHEGKYGAAFERDDETAFFYLLDLARDGGDRILEAFNAHTIPAMPADVRIDLEWTAADEAVGLRAGGNLIALFDLRNKGRKGRWATKADEGLFVIH